MPDRRFPYACLLPVLWIAAAPKALALLTFDDGKDRVFVTATYSFGYDSNVFTQQVARGALTQAFSTEVEYTRRAGVISVDATVTATSGTFAGIEGQDFTDPGYAVTFAKGTGRTTGSLGFTAQRQDVPDPVANNRAISWSYGSDLDLRYPVNERLFLTDSTGFTGTYYTNTALFADQLGLSNAFDANLVYDSKLNLNGGYTFDMDGTRDTEERSQGFVLGADGSILPKLTGSLDVGYEWSDADYTRAEAERFSSLVTSTSLKWAVSRQLTVSATATEGLAISSIDITTDTLTATLSTDIAIGKRLRGTVGLDYIPTAFLGRAGAGRRDTLWEVPVTLYTAVTTHVRLSLSYAYEVNYSNFSTARFVREVTTFSVTATY